MAQPMSLLQVVQAVCAELGLIQPAQVVGTSDLQTQQLLALANREGNELYRSNDWTCLQGEHIVNVDTPITYTGDVTANSTLVTNMSSTAGLVAGQFAVSGLGQPAAQRVAEIVSSTSVRMEMQSTASGGSTPLIFARDTYEIPSDFDRYITATWWDRTNHWALIGPQSPQADQWQRSGIVTTGPRLRWRQIGERPNVFRLWPPPTTSSVPDALVFEFVSDGWVKHADETYGSSFTSDSDECLLNPQMLILGIKWRFWQIKGFEFGGMQQEYIDFVNREKARDGGMPDLAMGRRGRPYLITSANVADGGWPGPGNAA